jgi:hypothetical protein
VEQVEFGRFFVRAEKNEEKILERVHKNVSPERRPARVSNLRRRG